MDFTLGLVTGMYAVLALIIFYVVYVIEVKLDLPAIVNGSKSNSNNNNNNELSDVSQTRLRNLIETIIAETLRSSSGVGVGIGSTLVPSAAVSEISLDTRSVLSNGNGNSNKRRHRTEHYFEPKIYQDLLATAVLNKIVDKEGNTRLISESTPDLSGRNIDENYNAEALSTTSGSSIEPRSDCSLTDNELVLNTGKSDSHAGLQVDLERESVLSDYIAAHMVPLPDFSASVTESEDDIASMSSSMIGDATWEDNWLFKKKRSTLQSSATPSSIGMLVPAPKENVRAQIGDRTADEVSDLSEIGSDAEETSLDMLRCNDLNDRLLSKHLIGGQNTKLVLDELVDRTSLTSNTQPDEHEPAFTETTNTFVTQPTQMSVPEEQMAAPPPMSFQDDDQENKDPVQNLIAAASCETDDQDFEDCTGFGDVEYLEDSQVPENIPSVIEILAAMALGPMLAVPASEQPPIMTATEIHTLKELSDLALAEISSRQTEQSNHSLDIIEEEYSDAQALEFMTPYEVVPCSSPADIDCTMLKDTDLQNPTTLEAQVTMGELLYNKNIIPDPREEEIPATIEEDIPTTPVAFTDVGRLIIDEVLLLEPQPPAIESITTVEAISEPRASFKETSTPTPTTDIPVPQVAIVDDLQPITVEVGEAEAPATVKDQTVIPEEAPLASEELVTSATDIPEPQIASADIIPPPVTEMDLAETQVPVKEETVSMVLISEPHEDTTLRTDILKSQTTPTEIFVLTNELIAPVLTEDVFTTTAQSEELTELKAVPFLEALPPAVEEVAFVNITLEPQNAIEKAAAPPEEFITANVLLPTNEEVVLVENVPTLSPDFPEPPVAPTETLLPAPKAVTVPEAPSPAVEEAACMDIIPDDQQALQATPTPTGEVVTVEIFLPAPEEYPALNEDIPPPFADLPETQVAPTETLLLSPEADASLEDPSPAVEEVDGVEIIPEHQGALKEATVSTEDVPILSTDPPETPVASMETSPLSLEAVTSPEAPSPAVEEVASVEIIQEHQETLEEGTVSAEDVPILSTDVADTQAAPTETLPPAPEALTSPETPSPAGVEIIPDSLEAPSTDLSESEVAPRETLPPVLEAVISPETPSPAVEEVAGVEIIPENQEPLKEVTLSCEDVSMLSKDPPETPVVPTETLPSSLEAFTSPKTPSPAVEEVASGDIIPDSPEDPSTEHPDTPVASTETLLTAHEAVTSPETPSPAVEEVASVDIIPDSPEDPSTEHPDTPVASTETLSSSLEAVISPETPSPAVEEVAGVEIIPENQETLNEGTLSSEDVPILSTDPPETPVVPTETLPSSLEAVLSPETPSPEVEEVAGVDIIPDTPEAPSPAVEEVAGLDSVAEHQETLKEGTVSTEDVPILSTDLPDTPVAPTETLPPASEAVTSPEPPSAAVEEVAVVEIIPQHQETLEEGIVSSEDVPLLSTDLPEPPVIPTETLSSSLKAFTSPETPSPAVEEVAGVDIIPDSPEAPSSDLPDALVASTEKLPSSLEAFTSPETPSPAVEEVAGVEIIPDSPEAPSTDPPETEVAPTETLPSSLEAVLSPETSSPAVEEVACVDVIPELQVALENVNMTQVAPSETLPQALKVADTPEALPPVVQEIADSDIPEAQHFSEEAVVSTEGVLEHHVQEANLSAEAAPILATNVPETQVSSAETVPPANEAVTFPEIPLPAVDEVAGVHILPDSPEAPSTYHPEPSVAPTETLPSSLETVISPVTPSPAVEEVTGVNIIPDSSEAQSPGVEKVADGHITPKHQETLQEGTLSSENVPILSTDVPETPVIPTETLSSSLKAFTSPETPSPAVEEVADVEIIPENRKTLEAETLSTEDDPTLSTDLPEAPVVPTETESSSLEAFTSPSPAVEEVAGVDVIPELQVAPSETVPPALEVANTPEAPLQVVQEIGSDIPEANLFSEEAAVSIEDVLEHQVALQEANVSAEAAPILATNVPETQVSSGETLPASDEAVTSSEIPSPAVEEVAVLDSTAEHQVAVIETNLLFEKIPTPKADFPETQVATTETLTSPSEAVVSPQMDEAVECAPKNVDTATSIQKKESVELVPSAPEESERTKQVLPELKAAQGISAEETTTFEGVFKMDLTENRNEGVYPDYNIYETHYNNMDVQETEIEAETRVEIDLLQMTRECIQSDISALSGKSTQKCLRRQPNILDTTPSDEESPVRPVNLLGTICKFYIKDKRLLATMQRRRERSLIMHKYLSSFDSYDEAIDDVEHETQPSLFEDINTYQHLSLDYSSDNIEAETELEVHLDNKPIDEELDVESIANCSDIASQTSIDLADDFDEEFFIVGSLTEIGYNFINHILFSDQLSSNSNASNASSPSTSRETFNGDTDSVNDNETSNRTDILDEAVSSSTLTTTTTTTSTSTTTTTINTNNKTNTTTQRILTNGSLRWSNKSVITLNDGQQEKVNIDIDIEDANDVNNNNNSNNNEDDVVLLRRFAPGSIAEREVKKWYNAVEMPNNPYAPEALKQRISGTQERFMDVPNIPSPTVEQKALAQMTTEIVEPANRVKEDYKRYSRDYYINNAPNESARVQSALGASISSSNMEATLAHQTDEDIVINEAATCVYTAMPVQVVDEGSASLESQSNPSMQSQLTTSDDSDTVRVYDFNKQETTVISKAETITDQPSSSSTATMESALGAPIASNTSTSTSSSSNSMDVSRKRERPVVLQFGPTDSVPTIPASPSMTPPRGSTPPAFRFLQPKRRLIEPSQVLSMDEDEVPPEPSTPVEKPPIEDEVAHVMPSVKALAQAFLLANKRSQPERRWAKAKHVRLLTTPETPVKPVSPATPTTPTTPATRRQMLQHAVSMAEVADESTIASDLSSLETDPSMQSEGLSNPIPIATPVSPVPVRRGFLRSNIAFFENLKFK